MRLPRLLLVCPLLLAAISLRLSAQTDEIQVYNAEIAEPGEFYLELHNNYTPDGRREPDFPGGVVPNHTLNGVPEWAYGVNDWLELGTYFAVYSVTDGAQHFQSESWKLRTLFVVPHAHERKFFYGINFEWSKNADRWEPTPYSGEIRPILGTRFGSFDFIFNPILDTGFNGLRRLDFAPCARLDYNLSPKWAVAIENYSDYGQIHRFDDPDNQQQAVWAVIDYNGKTSVEFGVGHGLDHASDQWVVKLMIGFSLNR
jgi:hypothetical protein